ncbi:MAG TPA: PEP-CTERM sorting domain-containing protein [Rhizomicrobium sp.]|nr:PEP-CTERM sorting domain-containing protein [Rhizomicrobium sp.]
MRKVVMALLGAASVVVACGAADATTIPFNYTIINTHTPADTDPTQFFESSIDLKTGTNPAPASSSLTNYNSPDSGYVGGTAYANMASGQLKAESFSNDPEGQFFYNQQNAIFGDGFRAMTPSGPFQWTPGSSGRFDITLDGTVSASPDITTMGVGGFIILTIYQPGTLDPNQNLVGSPNILAYYMWLVGNPNQNIYSCDFHGNCVPLTPNEVFTDFGDAIHVSQDINVGGDFDWSLILGFSGQDSTAGYYDMDFSHTLDLSYTGPDGTTTGSISGAFPNTVLTSDPVDAPEPFTLSLFGAGLAGLSAARRRRKAS